jgi:hypothetical protein
VLVTATAGAGYSGTVGTVAVPAGAAGTALRATIGWGDGTASAATVSGGELTGTHTYARPGAYRTTVTLTDAVSGSTLATAHGLAAVRG